MEFDAADLVVYYNQMNSADSPYVLDSSLGHLASRFSKAVLKRIADALQHGDYNVTSEQWSVLVHVWTSEGQTQRMLGSKLIKDKTNIARLVSSLESLGYILRSPGAVDGREKRIFLTDYGKTSMQGMTAIVQSILDETAAEIDDHELEICKNVLRRAYLNLK